MSTTRMPTHQRCNCSVHVCACSPVKIDDLDFIRNNDVICDTINSKCCDILQSKSRESSNDISILLSEFSQLKNIVNNFSIKLNDFIKPNLNFGNDKSLISISTQTVDFDVDEILDVPFEFSDLSVTFNTNAQLDVQRSVNPKTAKKKIDQKPIDATIKSRPISAAELNKLKSGISDSWKDILSRKNESPYQRSVRATRLLYALKAHEIIHNLTPTCTRIYLSKGKLFIEEKNVIGRKKIQKVPANHESRLKSTNSKKNPSTLSTRLINNVELRSLQAGLGKTWNAIYALPNEKSYERSVRVTAMLSFNKAETFLQNISPLCSRIFLSRNKLFVEENIYSRLYGESTITIYNHGLFKMPSMTSKFVEAPISMSKYLFQYFSNFSSASTFENGEKKNDFLNNQLKKLSTENRLPSCFTIRKATFIDCKLHLSDTTDIEENQLTALDKPALKKLLMDFPILDEYIFINPHASDIQMSALLEKLRQNHNFPEDISYEKNCFVSSKVKMTLPHDHKTPDIHWNLGGFDIQKISLTDEELKEFLKIRNNFDRATNCIFHLNLKMLKNEITLERIPTTQWQKNFIKNVAILAVGEESYAPLEDNYDYQSMADLIIKSCPINSFFSRKAADYAELLSTLDVVEMVKEKFELDKKSINDEYTSFVTRCLSKCTSKKLKLSMMMELLESLQTLELDDSLNIGKSEFSLLEEALRQTANSILYNTNKITTGRTLPRTIDLSTESNLKRLMTLLEDPEQPETNPTTTPSLQLNPEEETTEKENIATDLTANSENPSEIAETLTNVKRTRAKTITTTKKVKASSVKD